MLAEACFWFGKHGKQNSVQWHTTPLLAIFLLTSTVFILVLNIIQLHVFSIKTNFTINHKPSLGYTIKTEGCSIPEMNPMDKSILKYIFNESKVICNNGIPPLIDANLTSLFLVESSFPYYYVDDIKLLKCTYQELRRIPPKNGEADNVIRFENTTHTFVNGAKIKEEFIRVICNYNRTMIYKDFFNFVPLKPNKPYVNKPYINILIIGIDAVSRLNLYRQMPKTLDYIKQLGAFEMNGYNKVADNSYPNLMPILTGLTEDELKDSCLPTEKSYFDNCSFIWNQYSELGYSTAFAEDSAWMGLFHYHKMGFLDQKIDYFWDYYNVIMEKEIGNNFKTNSYQCVGGRRAYKVLLDYLSIFTESMQTYKKPYFGFFWGSSLSHDYVNKPKLGDNDYYNLLTFLNDSGKLKNTALIFLSDHGIRWGGIRSTFQGQMEERLPFLFLKLPDWFVKNNKDAILNLKRNTKRLTTPFDLHETLKSLLDHRNLRQSDNNELRRGYSLFDIIPTSRTCEDAGIASHWCTCLISTEIDVSSKSVIEAANFTVNKHINHLLFRYYDCAQLELDEILSSRLLGNAKSLLKSAYSQDYIITFKTKPGGAIFEATVRKYVYKKSQHYNITGTISRINLYGKQSFCITNAHLKLYCYCKKYVSEK